LETLVFNGNSAAEPPPGLMVNGSLITGSPLPTAEPSEVRLPVMVIITSALAVWPQTQMRIAARAGTSIRTPLTFRIFRFGR